jgi:hypothetical protein
MASTRTTYRGGQGRDGTAPPASRELRSRDARPADHPTKVSRTILASPMLG